MTYQPGTVYKTGKHSWRHYEVVDRWRGQPTRWMLGPCPACGAPTSTYGGGMNCHNDYCANSAMNFTCSAEPIPKWWNTGVQVYMDGDKWCAVGPDFINLQESPAGFGTNPREAAADLERETASDRA